ncbi:MAG: DUF1292 domain-containing protein [Eubacteriales bacterium]|nr:DUF1292 domain-containing protein [Eubacteriales bacterium]
MEELRNEEMEYVTFSVTARDGREVEMAVVDEFDFEHRHYVVASVVEEDTIQEGIYIYLSKIHGDDFEVEQISDEEEFTKVAEAYAAMED